VLVHLHNPNRELAFQISFGVHDGNRDDRIPPVLWQDNYISLLPNESRVVVGRYAVNQLGSNPELRMDGWNVVPGTIMLNKSAST
jgi:exo-1,4-beta-D-glucosaminidase